MPVSDSLFCFTSNKVDIHPCPDCRAPMLVRTKSIGLDLSARMFECFNCDMLDRPSAYPKHNARPEVATYRSWPA